MSGSVLRARRGGYCERAQPASPNILYRRDSAGEHDLHLPSKQIGECGPATTMGHVYHVDAGHHLKQFAGQMCSCADAGRHHIELAGVALGVGDELGNRLAGTDGFTTMAYGPRKTPATGAMSRMKL
jgi:hypothetical protein